MFFFSENLTCFVFLLPPFWDPPFCLITGELCDLTLKSKGLICVLLLSKSIAFEGTYRHPRVYCHIYKKDFSVTLYHIWTWIFIGD